MEENIDPNIGSVEMVPKLNMQFESETEVTTAQAIEANMADESGIPQKSAFELMSRQVRDYIVKRWTKGAKLGSVEEKGSTIEEDPKLAIKNRFRKLSRTAIKLTTWAAETEEGCAFLNKTFREAMLELERISFRKVGQTDSENVTVDNFKNLCSNGYGNGVKESDIVDGSKSVNVKGLKKKDGKTRGKHRYKSCLELNSKRKKNSNSQPCSQNVIFIGQDSNARQAFPPLTPCMGYTFPYGSMPIYYSGLSNLNQPITPTMQGQHFGDKELPSNQSLPKI
ncbi:protein FAR1-RELATED SEQUENCE 12-like protein [Corchorus olitorius]|uniref:Protein FAR1-RELATED SEQUENCE 12-like protein n=1 Tax=Corchorus olitorius TaxID=93759 RepID=A0A1R3JH35_9ROSI|nr:protein FAR1-RELATED SEQUENCE 12-like protein [Corchorus olitorius]